MKLKPPIYPMPGPEDYHRYVMRLFFGPSEDRLASCIRRAYRDMSRTLHGLSAVPNREALKAAAVALIRERVTAVAMGAPKLDQDGFDRWHSSTCAALRAVYREAGFGSFRVGQAQKWLNMTLKYAFVFGDTIPHGRLMFPLAHVPLDNIILGELLSYGRPRLSTRWSRLESYDEYLEFQAWVRQAFPESAPLAVEFNLWQQAAVADAEFDEPVLGVS